MLKIVAIGNLTNDVELKVHEATGKPYTLFWPTAPTMLWTLARARRTSLHGKAQKFSFIYLLLPIPWSAI